MLNSICLKASYMQYALKYSDIRYTIIILLGFGIDTAVALVLNRIVGLPLELSVTFSFIVALCANYVLFEFVAFPRAKSALSSVRFLQTASAALAALMTRVGIIALSGQVLGETLPEVMLAITIAAAASFCVNFVLVRLIYAS
jgi:putative flippase GtrA